MLIYLASLILLICLIATTYYFFNNRMRKYQSELMDLRSTLQKSKEQEQSLQQELEKLQNKLNKVNEDPITHLVSWDIFEDKLAQSFKESSRYEIIMAILFVDIDNFKMINQVMGDEVGNILLSEVAKRLQLCIRQVDNVSRFSKDIFVILLSQLAKQESAAIIAQRILQSMSEVFLIGKHELYITVGIGVSLYPGDGNDIASLMRNADSALQLAKTSGKGGYQFYQKELHANTQRDLALYTSFNKGSVYEELSIFYQPILNWEQNHIVSVDLQLHWEHPEWGKLSEYELFSLAKQQRKLNMLSEWIIEHACETFLSWEGQGVHLEFISVPLCSSQLEDSHFIYQLSHIFQKWNFDPSNILIQIRDSISSISLEVLEKSFNMLKYIGLKIAIDKFGYEAFSLSSLKNLSIGYLKLDYCLIEDITTNQKSKAVVKSILYMAKNLSIQVIAPGVKSEEEAIILKELKCLLLQGPWIAPPVSEQEVVASVKVYN